MYYKTLAAEIQDGRFNTDYKLRVICHLAKSPKFTASKVELCQVLSKFNKEKPHPYFMKHGTVFDVLSNRLGLIEKVGENYKLAGNLTKSQIQKVGILCAEKLEELGF